MSAEQRIELHPEPPHRLTLTDVYNEMRHVFYGNGEIGLLEDLRNLRREQKGIEERLPDTIRKVVIAVLDERAQVAERRAFPWGRLAYDGLRQALLLIVTAIALLMVLGFAEWVDRLTP